MYFPAKTCHEAAKTTCSHSARGSGMKTGGLHKPGCPNGPAERTLSALFGVRASFSKQARDLCKQQIFYRTPLEDVLLITHRDYPIQASRLPRKRECNERDRGELDAGVGAGRTICIRQLCTSDSLAYEDGCFPRHASMGGLGMTFEY